MHRITRRGPISTKIRALEDGLARTRPASSDGMATRWTTRGTTRVPLRRPETQTETLTPRWA